MTDNIEHRCPYCGASLRFDIQSQKIGCPYCGGEFTADDLTKNEGDLTVEVSELPIDAGCEWDSDDDVSEYVCESCGGAIYTDANTSATMCPYCGSAVILRGRLSGSLKPDKVIPFKQTKEEALDALTRHIKGKRFVAKGFFDGKRIEEVKGLYVPFWVYDAEMSADVEYEGIKESGDESSKEYRHYRVKRSGEIAFDHVPVDGSLKMPDQLMESIEPFDYSKTEEFKTAYLTGYVADKYDVGQEQASRRARRRMEEGAADAFQKTVRGYTDVHVRDVRSRINRSDVSYVLYPVWLLNTEWEGKKYTFAMNGQSGKMVGNIPVNRKLFNAVSIAMFLLLAALIGGGLCAFVGSFNPVYAIVGAVFSLAGTAAFHSYFNKKLENVEFRHGAKDYYRKDSMNITSKSDEFMYKS